MTNKKYKKLLSDIDNEVYIVIAQIIGTDREFIEVYSKLTIAMDMKRNLEIIGNYKNIKVLNRIIR